MPSHPSEPDDELAHSFARLIDRFWAGNRPKFSGGTSEFLLQQFQAGRSARLLCSPRAILAHACALADSGCLVFSYPPSPGSRLFEGSLWCGTEMLLSDHKALREQLTRLAADVMPGRRLLVDIGRMGPSGLQSAARFARSFEAGGWTAPVETVAPDGRLFLITHRCASPSGTACCNCYKSAPAATNL
jgi:hypothetical protein